MFEQKRVVSNQEFEANGNKRQSTNAEDNRYSSTNVFDFYYSYYRQ